MRRSSRLNEVRQPGVQRASGLFQGLVPGKRWKIFFPRWIIWDKWRDIVGEIVSDNAWPWYFKGLDCLVVAVADNIWMHQLSYEKKLLINKINSLLPKESYLEDLDFRIADITSVKRSTLSSLVEDRDNSLETDGLSDEVVKVDPDEVSVLQQITDEKLQETFKNILLKIKALSTK